MANIDEKEVNSSILEGEESILADVDAINDLIESEKKKQKIEDSKEKTSKKSPRKTSSVLQTSVSKPVEIEVSTSLQMERLHLRVVNDTIDILYRPTHCYIAFVPNDENGKAEVKRVALMSRDEFIEYLKSSNCFRFNSKKDIESISRNSSDENWYKGAWSLQTKKLLEELEVSNPIEEVISASR